MTEAQKAVLEAAKAWERLWLKVGDKVTMELPEERALLNAVRALPTEDTNPARRSYDCKRILF